MFISRLLLIPALTATALAGCGTAKNQAAPAAVSDSVSGITAADTESAAGATVLIIYYDRQTGDAGLLKAVSESGSEIVYEYKGTPTVAVRLPAGMTADDGMALFRKVPGVISVTPDRQADML